VKSVLPFASTSHDKLTPLTQQIHAAVWDCVGLAEVQEYVREWAADWLKRYKAIEAAGQEKAKMARQALADLPEGQGRDALPEDLQMALYEPEPPELPLPPSHWPRSVAEKWAALAAVHDVFDGSGDKILPWPVPADDENLAAFREWQRGEGGAFWGLMEAARRLTAAEVEWVARWLVDVQRPAAAPQTTTPGAPPLMDGPLAPDAFVWNGKTHHGLAHKPFLTLQYLWHCKGRAAQPDADLAAAVYGDREEDFPDHAVRGLRQALNGFFRANALPFHARKCNGCLTIADGAPTPVRGRRHAAKRQNPKAHAAKRQKAKPCGQRRR